MFHLSVPRKARSPSQRVPRKGLWGVQVLHQHTVQQVGEGVQSTNPVYPP